MNTSTKMSVLSVLFIVISFFPVTLLDIRVDKGNVFLKGSFLDFRDPLRFKHQIAAIESVLTIRINATFLITPVKMNELAHKIKVSYSANRL